MNIELSELTYICELDQMIQFQSDWKPLFGNPDTIVSF